LTHVYEIWLNCLGVLALNESNLNFNGCHLELSNNGKQNLPQIKLFWLTDVTYVPQQN